ncbi:UNVERIFIED_ORG: hypothetical protein GGE63_002760 [Rhizobium esperanzae]
MAPTAIVSREAAGSYAPGRRKDDDAGLTEILEILANAERGPIKSDHVKAVEYLMTDPDHCGGLWPQDLTAAIVDLLTTAEEEAEQLSSLSDGDLEGARDRLVQEMQKAETDGGARCMTNPGAGRYSNRRSIGSASDASTG